MTPNPGTLNLISIVNRIQESFLTLKLHVPLDLPQIAVVGGQSAGKSSVLESFVGKDFLPRGSGVVTRRPLILQLINAAKDVQDYGEFLHLKGQKFFDFDNIRQEIEDETERLTGKNKGIVDSPITLRIYSSTVLDLTLVDLPGMTKVPIGDQPADIEKQIKKMVLKYIRRDKCLILAVTPANSDLANSDALKLAREVDPKGLRTISVITKLDLMDEGTDAREILENKLLPLRRGYIGVVNRSQLAINEVKNIQDALQDEKEFFENHPSYRHIADRLGIPYLQKTLHLELTNHIRDTLPSLRDLLHRQMMVHEKDVEYFKQVQLDDPGAVATLMIETLQQLHVDFETSISGSGAADVSTEELTAGAKINNLFNESLWSEIIKNAYDGNAKIKRKISVAIQNAHGINSGVFTPDVAFDVIIKQQIAQLKEPVLNCVEQVIDELSRTIYKCTANIQRYPKLRVEAERLIIERLRQCQKNCQDQLALQIEIELIYMNTKHADFVRFTKLEKQTQLRGGATPATAESDDTEKLIHKGFLACTVINKDGRRDESVSLWCALTTTSLTLYHDDINEKEKMLTIEEFIVKVVDRGFLSQVFELTMTTHLMAAKRSFEFECDDEDFYTWKAAFLQAGMLVETSSSAKTELERQVETIYKFAGSYFRIVCKKLTDTVPKVIVMMIIKNCKSFITRELLALLYSSGEQATMMSESPDDTEKREEAFRMYNACKESLNIIGDISIETITKGSTVPVTSPEVKKTCLVTKKEEEKHEVYSQGFGFKSLLSSAFGTNKSYNDSVSVSSID